MRPRPLSGKLKAVAIVVLLAYVVWAIVRPSGRLGVAVQFALLTLMVGTALTWLVTSTRDRPSDRD